jgi:dephospho-CoA kinase
VNRWTGKYVIGLTGNIGTGKSVVRKMLEHLGAYGIDADALGHRAIAKGAPGYQPVLQAFGSWILGADEQVDRAKLGKLVFSDPEAMSRLERIVHPLVDQAVDMLVRRAPHRVVVVEAIKLLESGLGKPCDAIWVSHAAPGLQLTRLMQNRHMSEVDARQRIQSQPPQETRALSKIRGNRSAKRGSGVCLPEWQNPWLHPNLFR